HWHDVLVGSLLGTVVSYFTYRQYYPSLASEHSHRPFSPRIKREEAAGGDVLPVHQPQRPSSSSTHNSQEFETALLPHHHRQEQQQQQQTPIPRSTYTNPFGRQGDNSGERSGHGDGHGADDYELEGTGALAGTVQRPALPEEVWKDEGRHAVSPTQGEEPTSTPNPYDRANATS
ncbi:hypothetical protein DXG03_003524, partial [Asterophora parasitica]